MKRGFISGVVISLLVAATILTATASGAAQADQKPFTAVSAWTVFPSKPKTSATTQPAASATSGNSTDYSSSTNFGSTGKTGTSTANIKASYAALGDSVASGLGLPYIDNATAQDKRCGRSSQAYAYNVAQRLGLSLGLYACSGASSGDLYTRQWLSNVNPKIQIDQAYQSSKPSVISITVGANDIGWSSLVRRCYAGTCGTATQTKLLQARILLMQRNVQQALQQISDRSEGSPPKVIITGYYNPVSMACVSRYPERITTQEVTAVSDGVASLNSALADVAGQHGYATFAAVSFSGHDLCSSDPWVQGLTDTAPIHPTAAGQQAIADSVIAAYKAN